MSERIHVTQEDIREGIPQTYSLCPVALAIRRELGVEQYGLVSVTQKHVFVRREEFPSTSVRPLPPGTWYKAPPEVTSFIVNFDEGTEVEPFEFEMEEFSQAEMREMTGQ
jgi:hypothetical protein